MVAVVAASSFAASRSRRSTLKVTAYSGLVEDVARGVNMKLHTAPFNAALRLFRRRNRPEGLPSNKGFPVAGPTVSELPRVLGVIVCFAHTEVSKTKKSIVSRFLRKGSIVSQSLVNR